MEKLNGVVETHYGNGQLRSRANYKDGNIDGLREVWYDNGQLQSRENYKDGKVVEYIPNNTKTMKNNKIDVVGLAMVIVAIAITVASVCVMLSKTSDSGEPKEVSNGNIMICVK